MPKALPKGAAPKFFVHNPDTMDRHDYKDVYAYIEHSANNGFYIVQGFDVSQWFKGVKQSFFASVHHMATTIPMLRMFAPPSCPQRQNDHARGSHTDSPGSHRCAAQVPAA